MIQYTILEAGGKCDRPPVIQNGDILEAIKFRYESNSVLTYKCQALHIMHGQPTVQCFNGHWTEAPKCIGIENIFILSLDL